VAGKASRQTTDTDTQIEWLIWILIIPFEVSCIICCGCNDVVGYCYFGLGYCSGTFMGQRVSQEKGEVSNGFIIYL
jgi:hypothetical protein